MFDYNSQITYNSFKESTTSTKLQSFDFPLVNIPIGGKLKNFTVSSGIITIIPTQKDNSSPSQSTLIKFGAFLAMLQKICNITDGGSNSLLQFEMVDDISIRTLQTVNDDTFIVTYPGNYSSNPNKCLIKYSGYDSNLVPETITPLPTDLPLNKILSRTSSEGEKNTLSELPNPSLAMRLSDVYININFIAEVISNLRGADGEAGNELDISIIDLLKGILSGVNTSLGGLNNFRIIYSEVTSQIQIISESPILGQKENIEDSSTERATINTFGFNTTPNLTEGSFVTSMDLNSELTDKMATQISVGAQNDGNTLNSNATSFSSYSKGLIDKLFEKKEPSLKNGVITSEMKEDIDRFNTKGRIFSQEILESEVFNSLNNLPKTPLQPKSTKDKIGEVLMDVEEKTFFEVYEDLQFSNDYIPTLENLVTNVSPLIIGGYVQNSNSPSPFFLPFNMSLEMFGLGGIRIFDTFSINGKGLPVSYNPSNIQLIIKSLSHTISLEGWKTKIETLSQPVFDVEPTIIPSPPPNSQSNNVSNGENCIILYGAETYSPTAGNIKNAELALWKYNGNDPLGGYSFQGKPLKSFSKMMTSGDGAKLPTAGYGIAYKLGEVIQKIGNASTAENLTGLTINSHYRSPVHNCKVNGASDSLHKTGAAVDIGTSDPEKLRTIILDLIAKKEIPQGGVGWYKSFIHYDMRGFKARWDFRNK